VPGPGLGSDSESPAAGGRRSDSDRRHDCHRRPGAGPGVTVATVTLAPGRAAAAQAIRVTVTCQYSVVLDTELA
jgi:hypothetical protein